MKTALEEFRTQFEAIEQIVGARDPERRDFGLRLTTAFVMFREYDRLRSADRPFDRRRYAEVLAELTELLKSSPTTTRGEGGAACEHPVDLADFVGGLYSALWVDYDDEQYLESVELLEKRFRWNDIPLDVVKDQVCLDTGCGGGRYTIALAKLGARIAVGLDVGWLGLRDAHRRSQRFHCDGRVRFVRGSVLQLPFPDQQFGFAVSNGVLLCTIDPEGGLRELARVLKPGAAAYIMVYGSGGLHWTLTDFVERIVAPVPVEYARTWLKLIGLPINKIFHYIDHWYLPLEEKVSQPEFERRLVRVGFTDFRWVPKGPLYDLAYRSILFPEDRDLFGFGVLRYLVRRGS